MENVLNFLADNYLYFMIGAVVLLFALIGFAVDGKKKKKNDKVDDNPIQSGQMQFGQNQSTPQNNVPNVEAPVSTELSNGMTTGFNQFSNPVPEPAPVVPEPTVTPQPNVNSEEVLSFGPVAADNNESIFTEPPVVDNTNNDALTFEMPSQEPTMETLDLVSSSTNEMANGQVPVSMTPEVPVQNEVSAPTPEVPQQMPEMPSLNNTLQ